MIDSYIIILFLGPPGPCAGAYVQDHSVTPYSARLVWTIGAETDHGDPIISYDVEGETDYHPGQWTTLMTGKIALLYTDLDKQKLLA